MGKRLDQDRQKRLEQPRTQKAIEAIEALGYEILFKSDKEIEFEHIGDRVKFFPYSGWHSGKSIKDGRGLENLLKQLKG